ncbi:MAG: lipopolysaccharide biosynthesis protein [Clostridiales bacterium]|nr:lipopolysaccharide biosynthesis protein [Clostridiales bacterium]
MVTWIAFVIGFVASPIATRLFVPTEKAKIDMFSIYASLIASTCYLGLDQAFVRFFREPPKGLTKKGLFTLCIVAALGFSLISSFALAFSWKFWSVNITESLNPLVFICLCIFSFCLVAYRFLSMNYRMEQNARLYTIQGVMYALVTKIAYLVVGFGSAKGEEALLSLTVLMGIFTMVCIFFQRKSFRFGELSQVSGPAVKELSLFALPLVPLSILSWVNSNISSVALSSLLGLGATGIYTSALGLASTINIIQTGFNAYWAPYVLENYKSDDRKRFFTVHRLMACLLTFFGLAVTLMQTPVFMLLGKDYRSSVIFFPFLFISPICYCLGETTGMGITISKKSYWTTIIFLFSAVINIGLCYLLIPALGMPGAAIASAIAAVLTLLLRTIVGERYYKAIDSYRYLIYTLGLMFSASIINLLIEGAVKYLLLVGILLLAFALYRKEVVMLWTTARQILEVVRAKFKRRKSTKENTNE